MQTTNKKKGLIGLVIAVVLVLICGLLPESEGITRQGLMSLGMFLGAIVMWICETMPMLITAFLVMFLFPVFGVMPLNTVFTSFGGTAFFFAIATFGISAALESTSIPLRICRALTKRAKGNSKALVIGLMFACAITSAIMSNLSTTIIYLSLALALLKANGCEPGKSNLGRCLLIGIPAMSGCGGMITPAGTPGNALIIGVLAQQGINISFLQWFLIFAPMALICCLISGLTLTAVFKPERIEEDAIKELESRVAECGPLKPNEKKTIAIILIILVL
ncbi:MAG: anion permease, partial [Firmicutes bacterium]|nr:anion permease [Bacillota bacterium]